VNWKQLQGQSVDGGFQLVEHLGGTDKSATFLAAAPGGAKAAVKLVISSEDAGQLLARWKVSESLSHPHLLRVFRSGTCELSNTGFLFLVIEYAEENLSQVLPQRGLALEEVREMLPPVLDALDYLHREGLVHGELKPGNIMAASDQLKLSSDGVMRVGDPQLHTGPYTAPEAASGVVPASDLWSLGVTLTEVLTQRRPTWDPGSTLAQLPENTPEQFRVLLQRCLIQNPELRGTLADVRERLRPPAALAAPASPPTSFRKHRSPLRLVVPAAMAVVLIGAFLAISHNSDTPVQPEKAASEAQTPSQAPPPVQSPPPSVLTEATDPRPTPEPEKTEPDKPQKLEVLVPERMAANASVPTPTPQPISKPAKTIVRETGAVVHQVLPAVPPKAMRTINGKVRVQVKVLVNREGDVVGSQFLSRGPSRYFADLTMQAAREWKFRPASSEQAWNLEFEFRRTGITAKPSQLDR